MIIFCLRHVNCKLIFVSVECRLHEKICKFTSVCADISNVHLRVITVGGSTNDSQWFRYSRFPVGLLKRTELGVTDVTYRMTQYHTMGYDQ